MKRRIVSLLLAVVMALSLLPASIEKAHAVEYISTQEITQKLSSWKSKLNGKYWNYYDRSVYDTRRNEVQENLKTIVDNGILDSNSPTNSQLGVTTSPCGGSVYATGCKSNYFSGGWQCFGFAWWIAYALFQSTYSFNSSDWYVYSGASLNSITLQPGDLVRVSNHSIVVSDTTNGALNCVEAWGGSGCKISWSPGFNWSEYTTISSMLTAVKNNNGTVYRYKYVTTDSSSQTSLVRKTYPSYGKIKATADTNMRTLPCSAGTDASSTVIEPVSKGETFTTTALILNNQGNHWYKVESSGGKEGYLPSSKMSWEETYTSDIRIVNKAEPTNITVGNSYTVQGTVKADYSEIAMLFGYVWNGTSVNNSTPIISTQDPVNGKSYPLAGSTIDKELTFNTLAVGNYTLTISANYRNYYAKDEKTAECHTGTVRLQTSNFNIVSAHTHSWNLEVGDTTHWEQCSCGAVRNRGEHDWYQAFDDQNHWYQCFYCSATYGGEPHNWLRDWDSNTHWQTCASCDAICGETEHSWYLTWDGNEHWYNCNYCPAHKGRAAHNISWQQISAPTCTKDGVKRATCSGCNLFAETGINKLGHSYKNGVCTRCSAKDPNYVAVDGVDRVYGKSRYDTAFQSADTLKKQMGVEKFSCAIVTSGDNFADALAGSYLAYVKNAPILLTDNDNIGDVMTYIQKNVASGATVYALGGKAVVTDKLLDLEKKGYDVKRLAGKSRFETNLEILKECGSVAGKDILVCTGFNFADSLSASAAKRPILLVDDKLTSEQKAYLKQQSGCKYCIVGGTGAVTSSVEKSLKSYGSVSRLAGSNRFETSVMVAKKFFSDPTTAVLAYGYNFPDGLCAGPLAATINAPLILTATGDEAQAAAYAKEEGIKDGYVLGGSALINDKAVKKIFSMSSGDKIQ